MSIDLSLAFCHCPYNYQHCFCKVSGGLWGTVLWKTFSIYYLQDTSPPFKSRFGPQRLPFFCAWASADTCKLHAEYLSTFVNALLCVILAVTARTRERDVPCLSSHFCHICCGDKQEGIFNRRHFLCWSGNAQGWWPCRHSANPICFLRRWRVFKQCRWWHFFLFDSLGQFIMLFLNWVYAIFYFPVNCPWHFERFYTTKPEQPCKWNTHNVQL